MSKLRICLTKEPYAMEFWKYFHDIKVEPVGKMLHITIPGQEYKTKVPKPDIPLSKDYVAWLKNFLYHRKGLDQYL